MKQWLLAAAIAVSVSACGLNDKSSHNPGVTRQQPLKEGDTPGFADVKSAIFEPHCTRCHAGFADYARVARSLTDIQRAIDTNAMPKNAPPLNSELKTMLASWIEAGAPEQ